MCGKIRSFQEIQAREHAEIVLLSKCWMLLYNPIKISLSSTIRLTFTTWCYLSYWTWVISWFTSTFKPSEWHFTFLVSINEFVRGNNLESKFKVITTFFKNEKIFHFTLLSTFKFVSHIFRNWLPKFLDTDPEKY